MTSTTAAERDEEEEEEEAPVAEKDNSSPTVLRGENTTPGTGEDAMTMTTMTTPAAAVVGVMALGR